MKIWSDAVRDPFHGSNDRRTVAYTTLLSGRGRLPCYYVLPRDLHRRLRSPVRSKVISMSRRPRRDAADRDNTGIIRVVNSFDKRTRRKIVLKKKKTEK